VVSGCGKKLLGAVMVGDAAEYGTLLQTVLNGIALPDDPEFLILPRSDGKARAAIGVDALPDTAQICSCNDVSKGRLCEAVSGGATTLGALKACTKAGTACGGCVPLVTQVMKAQMKKQGLAVNNHLCEHFAHSRQELFHLVKVEGIRTFDALLGRHGKGLGCDICKPVAASIFASCWNDFILKREHAALQDSNDYFLGNIQKDGTYSVVPRMPGGEVTPDGLMAVAQVAKNYGLYTKITGGQRVDLFGARVDQLPAIWERTHRRRLRVRPCLRQVAAHGEVVRGLHLVPLRRGRQRGPGHRTGEPLQGPARAAQDQVRRVRLHPRMRRGAGQGRRRHRHRQGLEPVRVRQRRHEAAPCRAAGAGPHEGPAAGLHRPLPDVLHPHRRPAAAHQRLARQPGRRPGLPEGRGGARQLGMAADLQADMQRVVDTYQCEWKAAVTNPETRKRFRQFVNSDQPDANVVFVQERGQIRPATLEERTARPALADLPA
jgi:nitrite reductase (NADH) large subunit